MTESRWISCREIVEMVTDYLEDQLDPQTAADLERHLSLCPGCEHYVDQMRVTIRLLGRVPVESLTPEVEDRLLSAFADFRRPDSAAADP